MATVDALIAVRMAVLDCGPLTIESVVRGAKFHREAPAWRAPRRRRPRNAALLRKCEYRQRTPELGVVTELLVAAYGAEPVGVLLQARSHADACPAADPREDAHVLPALVL